MSVNRETNLLTLVSHWTIFTTNKRKCYSSEIQKDFASKQDLISKGPIATPLLIIFPFEMKVASGFSRIRIKNIYCELYYGGCEMLATLKSSEMSLLIGVLSFLESAMIL